MARGSKSEPKHSETAGDGSIQRPPLSGRKLGGGGVQRAALNSQRKRSKGPIQTLQGRGPRDRFKLSREEVQRADSNSPGKRSKGPIQTRFQPSKVTKSYIHFKTLDSEHTSPKQNKPPNAIGALYPDTEKTKQILDTLSNT